MKTLPNIYFYLKSFFILPLIHIKLSVTKLSVLTVMFLIIFNIAYAGTSRNDCPALSQVIGVNDNGSGSVTHSGNNGPNAWDSYKISIPSDGNLTITYNSDSNTRVWFTTNSNNWCRNDNIMSNGSTVTSTLSNLTSSDTVYIQLREMISTGTTNYSFSLSFSTPSMACGDTSGLNGKYYNNTNWSGTPALERNDKTVDFNWGTGSPQSGTVNSDNFSVQWTGFIYIPEDADYTFSFLHDDDLVVNIGGQQVYNYNNWSQNQYRNDGPVPLTKGCHSIELKLIEGGGGASAIMRWRNDASISSDVVVPESNLFNNTAQIDVANANDLCYDTITYSGPNTCYDSNGIFIGGQGCVETITIANDSRTSLTNITAGLSRSGISSSDYSDCGIDGSQGACSDTGWVNYGVDDTDNAGITYDPLPNYNSPSDSHTVYVISDINATFFKGDNLFGSYTKDGTTYRGKINPCIPSYCKAHGLGEGFHVIDPDGGDDINSYEIYCDRTTYNGRDLIDLPLKNNYNNFVFDTDSPSSNYYAEADTSLANDAGNSFNYLHIRINSDNTISVVTKSITEDSLNNKGYISNINLIGTPFYIDSSSTVLSHCDSSKLRTGSDDQAWKIDTLDYTNGRCKVDSMKLKLLDNYQYLTFPDINSGSEILEETCRQIFETVPDATGYLPASNGGSDGYFWIDPDQGGRVSTDTLDTLFRPIVAYCKYQEDISQAWTFVMALDGKVTNSKNDIKTMDEVRASPSVYHDTCSQIGLLFYVPNTKDTFERTRKHLYDLKSEWINYTGTIREKYKMYQNNPGQEYYIPGEGYNEIWPYGPFGLYFPQRGNRDVNGSSLSWYPGSTSTKGNMSGACMNSGVNSQASTCTDHGQNMGDMGWRTTLEDQVDNGLVGINNGDQFWIADVGAGNYLTRHGGGTPEYSVTGPGQGGTASAHRTPYYEPNGNYTQFAWLNFISDSNGNVYHNDDNNAFYSYYDYMCMAWDNYRDVVRIQPIEGPFTIIDENLTNQPYHGMSANLLDYGITTKIVNRDMNLQIVTFDKTYADPTALVDNNQSINAGVYLTYITTSGTDDILNLDRYFGDIGGISPSIAINSNGYHTLTPADWGVNKRVPDARRKMQVRFNYCQYNQNDWTSCWDGLDVCKSSCDPENVTCNCKYASSDFFAVRPKEFTLGGLSEDPELLRSGRTYNFTDINAIDDLNGNSNWYNQLGSNIEHNSTLYLADGTPDDILSPLLHGTVELNISTNFDFTHGVSAGNLGVTFDDVAKLNVEIYDNDWASIDSADSEDICNNDTPPYGRRICTEDTNVTFIPNHFEVRNVTVYDHDDRFTYLTFEDDLNMSMSVEVDFIAKNDNNDTTLNFKQGIEYYENPVEVNLSNLPQLFMEDNVTELATIKKDIPSPQLIGFTDGTNTIPWNETNTSKQILFNYNKLLNTPRNPVDLNISTVQVGIKSTYTSSSGSTAVPQGNNNSSDGNVTLYYARIKSSNLNDFYEDIDTESVQTPIEIHIYCDFNNALCNTLGIDISNPSSDSNWYFSTAHNVSAGDGNIALRIASLTEYEGFGDPTIDGNGYPTGSEIQVIANGERNSTVHQGPGPTLPMTLGIDIVRQGDTFAPPFTNGWLVHNPDHATNFKSPFYKVRFIGEQVDWSGVGTVGHAMDVNISEVNTNRMDW